VWVCFDFCGIYFMEDLKLSLWLKMIKPSLIISHTNKKSLTYILYTISVSIIRDGCMEEFITVVIYWDLRFLWGEHEDYCLLGCDTL
jgi:hypothetical protein